MILETARLQLREMTLSDIKTLSSILKDEKVCMLLMSHLTMKKYSLDKKTTSTI